MRRPYADYIYCCLAYHGRPQYLGPYQMWRDLCGGLCTRVCPRSALTYFLCSSLTRTNYTPTLPPWAFERSDSNPHGHRNLNPVTDGTCATCVGNVIMDTLPCINSAGGFSHICAKATAIPELGPCLTGTPDRPGICPKISVARVEGQ